MGPIGCPETSLRNCHYTLRNILEERRSIGGCQELHFISLLSYRPAGIVEKLALCTLHVSTVIPRLTNDPANEIFG